MCNENGAYVMPCVTAHAVTSCTHCMADTCRQADQPYVNVAHQELLMDTPFVPAKLYLRKLTASHFSTLNKKIANQNMLKMILIAIHNENKADCNENFRICTEESVGPLYAVDFKRPVGTEISQLHFLFWSILDS